MSIRWKLICGALSFLLLFVAVFVVTTQVTAGQKDDGRVINLAGRQRMLSQKMAKELLAYAEDPSEENWTELTTSKAVFTATLAALQDGGDAPSTLDPDGEKMHLPGSRDAEVRARFETVASELEAFGRAADSVESEARAAKDEGDMVVAQVPVVLARLDAVVQRAQRISQDEMLSAERRAEWAQVIRLLSRQSLLAQRLGTQALGYLRDPNEEDRKALEEVVDVFEGTHTALAKGGSVVLDLDDVDSAVMIASAPDRGVQEALLDAGDAWSVLRRSIRGVQLAAVARADAVKKALGHAPAMLGASNEAVLRIQELSEAKVATIQTVQVVALLLGLVFVVIAAVVGNRIGRSIGRAVDVARTIADGDLTRRCPGQGRDETARLLGSLDEMGRQLGDLVHQVQLSCGSVGSSSTQIAASARRQETTVGELASSATQIAATSTEIAATAEELLQTMTAVGEASASTSKDAASSKRDLESMQRSMAHMVEGTESLQARLAAISEKTSKISTIVTTIMKIAQQTNLISLNAAIEAENAGELGLGFAVVAKEVRRLADQTAKASKGIEQMVKEMQSTVGTAVMGMDGFAEDIRTGSTAVQQAAGRMGGIIERVEHLVPRFDDVRQGMSAQAHGASQIADGVRQIVDASQETSQSVRQTNDAITQLTRAAQELQAGISRFRVNGSR